MRIVDLDQLQQSQGFQALPPEKQATALAMAKYRNGLAGSPGPTGTPTVTAPSPSPSPSPTPSPSGLLGPWTDFGVRGAGMLAGEALAAPVAAGLTAGLGAVPFTAPIAPAAGYGALMAGSGLGAAVTDMGIEAANQAAGYPARPEGITGRFGQEFKAGAGAKVIGSAAGAVVNKGIKPGAKWFFGVTGLEKAREAIGGKIASTWEMLRSNVDELLYKMHGGRETAKVAGETATREGFKETQRRAFDDIIGLTPEESASYAARTALDPTQGGMGVEARAETKGIFRGLYRKLKDAYGAQYQALRERHYDTLIPGDVAYNLGLELRRIQNDAMNFQTLPTPLQGYISNLANLAETGKVRIGDLFGKKGDIFPYFDSAHGPARNVANAVRQAIAATGIPESAELNQAYSLLMDRVNPGVLKQMYHGEAPEDFGKLMTTKVMGTLLSQTETGAERDALAGMVSQYVRRTGMKMEGFINTFPPEFLEKLYGPEAAAQGRLLQMNANYESLGRMLGADPELATRVARLGQLEEQRIARNGFRDIKKQVMSWLGKIGKPAEDLRKQLGPMDPEQVAYHYFTEMQQPAFLQGLLGKAPLPSVVNTGYLKWHGERLAAVAGFELWQRGHVGAWTGGMSAFVAASVARRLMMHAFLSALESPAKFGKFTRAVTGESSQKALTTLARMGAQFGGLETLRRLQRGEPEPPASQPTQPQGPALSPAAGAPSPSPTPQMAPPTAPPTVGPTAKQWPTQPAPPSPLPTNAQPLSNALRTPTSPQAQQELERLRIQLPQERSMQVAGVTAPARVTAVYRAMRDRLVHDEVQRHLQMENYRNARPDLQRRIVQKIVNRMSRIAHRNMAEQYNNFIKDHARGEVEPPEPPPRSGP